ncbi:MAG: hypothetical protein ABIT58_09965 [Ferruginibacter sp.]
MKKSSLLAFFIFITQFSFAQKIETVYLDSDNKNSNFYIAVLPENKPVKAFMFLLDGYGASPMEVLLHTDIPAYAAEQGILTLIPILKTGALYFGIDSASQQSLHDQVNAVVARYHLEGKDLYIGGLSIGGSCAVKFAELAVRNNYKVKPKAVFGVDPPLDFEHFYNGAKRVVRLSGPNEVSREVTFMLTKIEKEMKGTPETAIENYYEISPYSFSDTSQRAVKLLINTPLMLISEPDIQWWLNERGYDYSYLNVVDHAAMINELQRLGNSNAVLVTTTNKGYRNPGNIRHPHAWSIADKENLIKWLLSQN